MSAYVYGFRDASGAWLYIGCTEYFIERIRGHRQAQPWWPTVAHASILAGPTDVATARRIERHLIETCEPAHNMAFTLAWRQQYSRDGVPLPMTELTPSQRTVLSRGWAVPWSLRDEVRGQIARLITAPVKRRAAVA